MKAGPPARFRSGNGGWLRLLVSHISESSLDVGTDLLALLRPLFFSIDYSEYVAEGLFYSSFAK